jgi:hypothetical protein
MSLSIKDALRIAKQDPIFAKQLLKDPAALKASFNLTDAQVAAIKSADINSILNTVPDSAPGGGAPAGGGIY